MQTSSGRSGRGFVVGVVTAAVAVVVLGLWPGGLHLFHNPFRTETKSREHGVLLLNLRDVSRYEAATGQFQVIVDLEKDTKYVPSVIKGEKVTFIAEGGVDAVVDFSKLTEGNIVVSADKHAATITLPAPRLSAPRLDPSKSRVMSRQRGVLNRIGGAFSDNPTNEQPLYKAAQAKIAAQARHSELLKRAEKNTRQMLTALLGDLGYTKVRVKFVKHAEPG